MTNFTHILLVEDEASIARVVKESLEQKGYIVTICIDGKKAINLLKTTSFNLCIVDVMLPVLDGFSLVQELRTFNTYIPVLFLTAKANIKDLIEGYLIGGNDYLRKPFSLEELFVRIAELLKRQSTHLAYIPKEYALGKYTFYPIRQELILNNNQVTKLSSKESQLLELLCTHRETLLPRSMALLHIWGEDNFFTGRTMDVFITKLRKHLNKDTHIEILNIRGVGYKLIT